MVSCGHHGASTTAARWLSAAVLLAWFGLSPLVSEGVAAASPSESAAQSEGDDAASPADADTDAEPTEAAATADDGGDDADDAQGAAESEDVDDSPIDDDLADGAAEELADDQGADDAEVATDADDSDDPSGRAAREPDAEPAISDREVPDDQATPAAENVEAVDALDALDALDAVERPAGQTDDGVAAQSAPPPTTPERTLRSLSAARPVTANSIVTDLLTWVGVRVPAEGLPVPTTPVSALVESLWLAVRQTQYLLNNQRPTADVTTSGPDPDGTVTGNLNAVDYDDTALTYTLTSAPIHGRVTVDAAGAFTYTPAVPGRPDRFTVTVDDTVGNPAHIHGLLGLLGLTGPTEVVVTISGAPARPTAANPVALADLQSRRGVDVEVDAGGAVTVIDGRFTDRTVTSAAEAASVLNALAPLLGAAPGFAAPTDITTDRAGTGASAENFYRYTETISGVTVLGSDIILVTDAVGGVTGLFNNYVGLGAAFDVTPDEMLDDHDEARLSAGLAHLGAGADDAAVAAFLAQNSFTTTLVVYALEQDTDPALAWQVVVQFPDTGDLSPSGATYVIDADGGDAGSVIVTVSTMQGYSVTGVGTDWLGESRTITVDRGGWLFPSYAMVDDTRNITTYSTSYAFFGLGGPVLPGRVIKRGWLGWNRGAVSAHANTAVVYDFYDTVLGRTSFDGAGALIEVSIRYNPSNPYGGAGYANAFWDPTRQLFGYGDAGSLQAALDVVGHEFTHAVVSYVVGTGGSVLDYGEPGALNEAYADILGALVEGKTGSDRWLIGEDSDYGTIRNLADPTSVLTGLGPYRDHYATRYTGTGDDGGEHINSTIFGHAAYLMMTDDATAGISDDTWARVFYHSLFRLSRGAVFADGRAAVLSSAAAQGFTQGQLNAIRAAFDDVGIAAAVTSAVVAA